ncbi:MAG TPA: nickel-responsive transcriptional regulator NikR [Candidatus Krumholzibacteria bacterium]|nr:nickel-responsive transcriptional regulator NikR [Candidatus Krumholzibacteria bacterium]
MADDATRRFTVSLPAALMDELDRRLVAQGYASRSELVRDLIRGELVREAWQEEGGEVHGVLTICYDHHRRDLKDRLHAIQHRHYVHTLCSTHVHLDHDNCLETIILRGTPGEIEGMALAIRGLKGVVFSELVRAAVPGA